MSGCLKLRFQRAAGETCLADLYQTSPLRVLFPYPMPGDPVTAALVNTAGGLVGGDHHTIDIQVGAGAAVLACAQAAEKVYRSLGADSRIDLRLQVGAGGWLEMLPQETILFDRSRLRRQTIVNLAPEGQFLGGEIIVLGRHASGEQLEEGLLQDHWEIHRDGRLVWIDRFQLAEDIGQLSRRPALLGGHLAMASMIMVTAEPADHLTDIRAQLAGFCGRASVTIINGVFVARWLSSDPLALRQSFAKTWILLRSVKKMPASLPRLWHI
jgi:urease accessory protein